MTFSKPALDISAQRKRLEARGLLIPDKARAEHYLSVIGYYRLSAYTRPFQSDLNTHRFHPNASFDDVLKLYIFDRELRLVLLDALERVEAALRTRINDLMCERTGDTHWYTQDHFFRAKYNHHRLMKEVRAHKDDFVENYHSKYATPPDIPSWMAMQALSFGAVQKILLNLKKREQEAVCKSFGFQPRPFVTWVYALVVLRNHCAHHARTWNRTFHVNLPLLTPPKQLRGRIDRTNHNILDGYTLVLDALMRHVSPRSQWWARLEQLVHNYHAATPHTFHQAQLEYRVPHLLRPSLSVCFNPPPSRQS